MTKSWRLFLLGALFGFIVAGLIYLIIKAPRSSGIELRNSTPSTSIGNISTPTFVLEGSKININTATKNALMTLPGIGEAKAIAIIEFRSNYGGFSTINELLYVPGIGSSLFDSIQNKVTIK